MQHIDKNIDTYIDDFRGIVDLFEFFVGLDSDVFRLIIEILPSIDLDIIYRIEIFDNKQWQIFIEHKDMNKLISEFKEKYNSSVTDEDAKI